MPGWQPLYFGTQLNECAPRHRQIFGDDSFLWWVLERATGRIKKQITQHEYVPFAGGLFQSIRKDRIGLSFDVVHGPIDGC